jgi:hypothetical protein
MLSFCSAIPSLNFPGKVEQGSRRAIGHNERPHKDQQERRQYSTDHDRPPFMVVKDNYSTVAIESYYVIHSISVFRGYGEVP